MRFCIPADFSHDTVEKIGQLHIVYSEHAVEEVYGNITPTPILGSGRGWRQDNLSLNNFRTLEDYIKKLNEYNILFNYTINSSCTANMELDPLGLKKILKFVDMLREIGTKRLTVASPVLIGILARQFKDMEVTASVISYTNTTKRALEMKRMGVKTIALDEDMTRHFKAIEMIHQYADVDLEIIVNSMCHYNCLFRANHYNALAHNKDATQETYLDYYTDKCLLYRKDNLEEYIKIPWIRPEDIKYYEALGVKLFKIIGREIIDQMDIIRMLICYFERKFDGNLLELIYGFSNKPTVYIDNKKLEGFIDKFKNTYTCNLWCGTVKCNYCSHYAKKAITIKNKNVTFETKKLEDIETYGVIEYASQLEILEGMV
jgi:collagenase-like PrtC family protease